MNQLPHNSDMIAAGETASIENTSKTNLSISLLSDSGCQVVLELHPGQIIGFTAGTEPARILLHKGNPAHLLVIKPESAS